MITKGEQENGYKKKLILDGLVVEPVCLTDPSLEKAEKGRKTMILYYIEVLA